MFWYALKQQDNIAKKDDFNSFIPATIKIFISANLWGVIRRLIAKHAPSILSTVLA